LIIAAARAGETRQLSGMGDHEGELRRIGGEHGELTVSVLAGDSVEPAQR